MDENEGGWEMPDHPRSGPVARPASESTTAASLMGETGRRVGKDLALLSMRLISMSQANPGFYYESDGTLGLLVDDKSFEALKQLD
jgi:hypothetical protein